MAQDVSIAVSRADAPDDLASRDLAALTRNLRATAVERVAPLPGTASPDSKGAAETFGLMITVAEGLPALKAALGVVSAWLRGSRSARSVTVDINGCRLVLDHASEEQQAALVQRFLASLPET